MTTERPAMPHPLSATSIRWQFSLRSLLAVMFAVAFLSGLWRIAPQLALFTAIVPAAPLSAWRLVRNRRLRRPIGKRLAIGVTLTWLAFYVVSAGPAVWVCQHGPMSNLAFEVFYSPMNWLYRRTPLRHPLGWYANYWRPGHG